MTSSGDELDAMAEQLLRVNKKVGQVNYHDQAKVHELQVMAVVVDLASTFESPEAVRDGYGGAYLSFFETCGLFFPIPEPVLNILAELGLSLTQMCPNFLKHLLALLVKAREDGLLFGLDKLRHLVLMKRNNPNAGTFLMSPRPGRQIVQGIPYRDQNWRQEASEDEAENSQEDVEASASYPPPSDRLERQLARRSLFRNSRSASAGKVASGLPPIPILDSDDEGAPRVQGSLVSLSPGLHDNSIAGSRKRHPSSKAVMHEPSRSMGESKGWELVLEGDGHLSMGQGDLISLARRTRSMECHPLSLASVDEEGAYAKVVVASSKESEVQKGKAEVQKLTEELQTSKEEARKKTGEAMILRNEWKRASQERAVFETEVAALMTKVVELEAGRDRDICRSSLAARCEVANGFREVLTSLEKRCVDKKKGVSAEIQLHEMVANLDLLSEIKEDGLVVKDEIVRLKEMEKDSEAAANLAAVTDWSVAGLDRPHLSKDSIIDDEAANSSVREEASS
ncbi:PREDICTED: uncharacterized protein LOC106324085 [Brassica oleracea var. oleracea]|uniref:uncharacterized protein LOC106324085 n=1 Tax=Brassica oleracea var. oleracea TaxID=109376 RepID=UPI0006A6C3F7|nr:PREDICTED: uncharacterized protein LOC106324085 [Brassica oleracea var. oleracea]